jgi:hypothetical protein
MSDQLTNFNGTRSESAPKVKAETVTGESRQAGGNPAGDTSLPEDVLAEMARLHGRRYERRWLDLIETHGKALLSCARRDMEQQKQDRDYAVARDRYNAAQKRIAELEATLLINQQYYTQQLDQFLTPLRKRIADLEAETTDWARKHLERIAENEEQRKRIAELEAVLKRIYDRTDEATVANMVDQALKGGAK